MRIIFFGSDDFAARHLDHLLKSGLDVVGSVTPEDKPKGRGMKVAASPVKECALKKGIKVFEPHRLKDSEIAVQLKALKPDLFVVIAYGKLLPEDILKIPSKLCINLHASLLPQYRGAAPIAWAIINGEKETGLSVIKMNTQMDAGDILAQTRLKILPDDTTMSLREKMMDVGPIFLLETIQMINDGRYKAVPQDEKAVTFAPKLTKELGRIDWQKSADEIRNLVRGLFPWPTAYTLYKGKILKILNADVVDGDFSPDVGKVSKLDVQGFMVTTGRKALLVKEVHFEASRPMDAASFIRGHRLEIGERLA